METLPKILRIVDANLNRIGEGLRFLEEMARLGLNDATLTRKLKSLRHELLTGHYFSDRELVAARDAEGDVGKEIEEKSERDLESSIVANARRVQESLRVLEELAKLPELPGWDTARFKRARFAIYTIEKEILNKLEKLDGKNLTRSPHGAPGL